MGAGSTLGAFFDGIQGTLGKKLEQKHEEEQARKKELRDFYLKGILNADTDEQAKHAAEEYGKLSGPQTKKGFQQIVPLLQKIRGARGQQQQQGGGPVPAPGGSSQPMDEKLPAGVQLPPRAQFDKGPNLTGIFSTGEQRQKREDALEEATFQKWYERGKKILGPKASERDLAEYAGSKGQRLPPEKPDVKTPVMLKLKDGTEIQGLRAKDGTYYSIGGSPLDPDSIERESEKKVNTQLAWFSYPDDKPGAPPHAVRVNPKDPSDRVDASTGEPTPKGANQINPTMIEAQIRQNSYGQMGNLTRALMGQGYTEEEAKRYAGQLVEQDYQKRLSLLGAGSIHEAIGQDAQGNAITIPLQTQRQPAPISNIPPPSGGGSPTATPAPAPAAAPGVSPSARAATPAPAPAATPAQRPQANAAPRSPALAPRMLPGVSAATAKTAAQYSVPITESVVQLFGDPKNPGVKSLMDYSKLADDPQASARIGKAIRLTMSGFGDSIGEASLGAEGGPLHVSSGGFGTWLQNKLNIPGAVASQQADMIKQAMTDMTPEEREAYDATMAEMSVMAGLRSISKSSAAMGSIRLIENEIPKIGINTADSRQFIDQLQKTAGAINNAVSTPGLFPRVNQGGKQVPVGISQEMMDRINGLPQQLQKMKTGPAKAPDKKASSSVVDDLLKDYGGAKK